MELESIPPDEMIRVAEQYLGSSLSAKLRGSTNPAEAFAFAWTGREAGLKCRKTGLDEKNKAENRPGIRQRRITVGGRIVGSVAVAD